MPNCKNKIRKVIKKLELEGIKYTFEDICEQTGLSKKIVKKRITDARYGNFIF